MSVSEIRILTIGWDPVAGVFDDSVLREYLVEREVLVAEPKFFMTGGRPYWTVYLETQLLQGSLKPTEKEERKEKQRAAAIEDLLSEMDEAQRDRYQRILQWRRDAARREGIAHFVLCTNQQAAALARRVPRSLQALASIKGFGPKRLKKHGREILEVLHGGYHEKGAREADPVREVDGRDEVADGEDGPVPEAPAVQPDGEGGGRDD